MSVEINGSNLSINDLVKIVAKHLNIDFEDFCKITPGRVGEDKQYWLDSSKIINDLGWKHTVSLDEGILEVVEWAKKYKDDLLLQEDSFTLRA